jgi:tetratricopeptide (TPR) repeat protein
LCFGELAETDGIGEKHGSEADARYLTFLSIAYNNIGFVEKAYKENGRAIEAFQKAADARAKSLHISPSANSATDLVEDYEALASLQKDLRDFDGANDCYDHAITELNSYLSGKTLTPAFSAILVRLHAARGEVFLEKKDRSGAEKEYKKAATEADGIDRKLQEARSYAVEADRTVGNAWRDLAEAVEDPAAKRKFIDLALRFPGLRQSEIGHG